MAVAEQTKKQSRARKLRRKDLPVKRTINLYDDSEKKINLKIGIPSIILIILAAAVLSKFAVVDRLVAVSRAQGEVASLRQELNAGYDKIDSFGELTEKYAHYTYSGMSSEELQRTDRTEILSLIERVVLSRAKLGSWSVTGNILTLNVTAEDLQAINLISQRMEEEEMVDFCTVTTAASNEIVLVQDEDGVREEEHAVATGRILVYLKNAEGVDWT